MRPECIGLGVSLHFQESCDEAYCWCIASDLSLFMVGCTSGGAVQAPKPPKAEKTDGDKKPSASEGWRLREAGYARSSENCPLSTAS